MPSSAYVACRPGLLRRATCTALSGASGEARISFTVDWTLSRSLSSRCHLTSLFRRSRATCSTAPKPASPENVAQPPSTTTLSAAASTLAFPPVFPGSGIATESVLLDTVHEDVPRDPQIARRLGDIPFLQAKHHLDHLLFQVDQRQTFRRECREITAPAKRRKSPRPRFSGRRRQVFQGDLGPST